MQPYAVIRTGGKQYTVQTGDVLNVELLPGKSEGDTVALTALAANTGSEMMIGDPELSEKVNATILQAGRDDKVVVLRRRRRSTFRKKNGHRQGFHAIRIDSIPGNAQGKNNGS